MAALAGLVASAPAANADIFAVADSTTKGKAKWNFRVNGKRLKRGTYQVTARAVTRSRKVGDLGKPRIIHVR